MMNSNSNISNEEQKLVQSMNHYVHKHHIELLGIHRQAFEHNDERSERISELSFEILSELAFARYDKELNNLFGDEE